MSTLQELTPAVAQTIGQGDDELAKCLPGREVLDRLRVRFAHGRRVEADI